MPGKQPPKKKMRLEPELVELSSDSSSSSSATTAAAEASAEAARSLPPGRRRGSRGGVRGAANLGRRPRAAANPSSGPRNLFSCCCQECMNMPSGSSGPIGHAPTCTCATCEGAEASRQARERRREGHFPTALRRQNPAEGREANPQDAPPRRLEPVEGREANLQDAKLQWPIRWDTSLGYHIDVEVRGTRNFEEVSLTSSSSFEISFYSSTSSSEGEGDVQARGP